MMKIYSISTPYFSVTHEGHNLAALTLVLSTLVRRWRSFMSPIELAALFTKGPSANVSKMASRASEMSHRL